MLHHYPVAGGSMVQMVVVMVRQTFVIDVPPPPPVCTGTLEGSTVCSPGCDGFARSGCFGTTLPVPGGPEGPAAPPECRLAVPSCARPDGEGDGGVAYPVAALFNLCCTETAYDGGGGLLCIG
uniref:Uncharacterized protein n=1 Tax=Anopheles culicifacies TaxID=139723 RepID=A0A182MNU0_9DIPT